MTGGHEPRRRGRPPGRKPDAERKAAYKAHCRDRGVVVVKVSVPATFVGQFIGIAAQMRRQAGIAERGGGFRGERAVEGLVRLALVVPADRADGIKDAAAEARQQIYAKIPG